MASRRQKILQRIAPRAVSDAEAKGAARNLGPMNPLSRGTHIVIPLGGSKHEKIDLGPV